MISSSDQSARNAVNLPLNGLESDTRAQIPNYRDRAKFVAIRILCIRPAGAWATPRPQCSSREWLVCAGDLPVEGCPSLGNKARNADSHSLDHPVSLDLNIMKYLPGSFCYQI